MKPDEDAERTGAGPILLLLVVMAVVLGYALSFGPFLGLLEWTGTGDDYRQAIRIYGYPHFYACYHSESYLNYLLWWVDEETSHASFRAYFENGFFE